MSRSSATVTHHTSDRTSLVQGPHYDDQPNPPSTIHFKPPQSSTCTLEGCTHLQSPDHALPTSTYHMWWQVSITASQEKSTTLAAPFGVLSDAVSPIHTGCKRSLPKRTGPFDVSLLHANHPHNHRFQTIQNAHQETSDDEITAIRLRRAKFDLFQAKAHAP